MKISNCVRIFREMQGITQSDLAIKVGISKNALSKIERAESIPSLDTAIKLCIALDVYMEDLFMIVEGKNNLRKFME